MKKLPYLFGLLLLLNSCEQTEIHKLDTEIIVTGNTTVNSTDFIKMVEPIEIEGEKGITLFAFYPLHLHNLKLDMNINLDYLDNKSVNYEKPSPIKRDFKKYFASNKLDSLLAKCSEDVSPLDVYLQLPNCFIYSDRIEFGDSVKGKKIYHDASALKNDLIKYTTNGGNKILILNYFEKKAPQSVKDGSKKLQHTINSSTSIQNSSGEKSKTIDTKFRRVVGGNKVEWSQELTDVAKSITLRFTVNGTDLEYEYTVGKQTSNRTTYIFNPNSREVPKHRTTVTIIPDFGDQKVKTKGPIEIIDQIFECSE